MFVQSACNSSGVATSFRDFLHRACENGWDTDKRNKHPISYLYAYKLLALAGNECLCEHCMKKYGDMHEEVLFGMGYRQTKQTSD